MQRRFPLSGLLVAVLLLALLPSPAALSQTTLATTAQVEQTDQIEPQAVTPVAVTTQHNDKARSGLNLNETILSTTNVNQNQFGLLYSLPVSGHVYAQPLYLPNLAVPNQGTHNVLFVATMHNSVYAFDADNPRVGDPASSQYGPLWKLTAADLNVQPIPLAQPPNSNQSPELGSNCGYGGYKDIFTEIGILSTPVIDASTNTIYFVAAGKTGSGTSAVYTHWLFSVDATSGTIKDKVKIQTPQGSSIQFDSLKHSQRPALLLANGRVYIAFASYCDTGPYSGWIFGYDKTNLQATPYIYNDTPSGSGKEGGLWQAGQGPTADANGNLYIITGNGSFANVDGGDRGDSIVKLSPTLQELDYFTPYNQDALNQADNDLGSSGVLLLPNSNLIVGGGKEGKAYLMDRNNMGGYQNGPGGGDGVVQSFQAVGLPGQNSSHHIHGSPLFWTGPNASYMYVWGESDYLRAYKFNPVQGSSTLTGTFSTTSVMTGTVKLANNNMPGGMMSISSNGTKAGTGIVWASVPTTDNANNAVVLGTLRAYDATNLSRELWNSDQAANGRDNVGYFAKFASPTVVNGRVYMPTFSNPYINNEVDPSYIRVYGLLSTVVTNPNDDGQPYSLSFALKNVPQGQQVWLAPYGTTTLNVDNQLSDPANVPYPVYLRGQCMSGIGPVIQINGNPTNGKYKLSPGISIGGVIFGKTLNPVGGNHRLNCDKVAP